VFVLGNREREGRGRAQSSPNSLPGSCAAPLPLLVVPDVEALPAVLLCPSAFSAAFTEPRRHSERVQHQRALVEAAAPGWTFYSTPHSAARAEPGGGRAWAGRVGQGAVSRSPLSGQTNAHADGRAALPRLGKRLVDVALISGTAG